MKQFKICCRKLLALKIMKQLNLDVRSIENALYTFDRTVKPSEKPDSTKCTKCGKMLLKILC